MGEGGETVALVLPPALDLSMPSHLDSPKAAPPPRRRRKVLLCACCSAVLVVAVAIAAMSAWFGPTGWIGHAYCHTEQCALVNAMLLEARNESVKPCDNFYRHVCGRWSLNHSGYTVYDLHLNAYLDKLNKYLLRIVVGAQARPTEKMARFYQTCTTILVEGQDKRREYHEAFNNAGVYWPRLGPSDADAYLVAAKVQASFLMAAMLSISRVKDFGGEVYLGISPASALRIWLRYRPLVFPNSSDDSTYRLYYENACQAYADGIGGAVGFDTFFDIEQKVLSKLLFPNSSHGSTNLTNLTELSNVMRPTSAKQLIEYLHETYNLTDATSVIVKGPTYLARFGELVTELGDDKVILYLGWLILQLLWRALDRRTNTMWHKHFGARVSSRIRQQQQVDCMELTEQLLGWALFFSFTHDSSGTVTTQMVDTMAENIGRVFQQQLSFNQIYAKLFPTDKNFTA
nr:neprilysin-1-like [Dermacentor andersoni]